jgi:hypothetical protein
LDIRPLAPYHKELTAQPETDYPEGLFDPTGLLGLWHLNEATAFDQDVLVDSSIVGRHGTMRANDADDKAIAGVFSNGIDLDGDVDFLSFGSAADIDDLSSFSTVAWVNPTLPGPDALLFAKGDISAGWSTYIDNSYGFGMSRRNAGVYARRISDANTIVPSIWNHVAVTWAGGQLASNMRLYHQGLTPGYSQSTNGSSLVSDADVSLRFGSIWGSIGTITAAVDEVAIFDRVLPPDEVLDIYKRGALRARYQVRSCDDPGCDTEPFVGPDGTSATFYSELSNSTPAPPVFQLTNLGENRYFQWRATLESDDPAHSPELIDVLVAGF